MPNRILVTFATQNGATAGVAEAIGQTLAESGCLVDVQPMNEVTDLTAYQAVVAGSAIQAGRWLTHPVSEGLFAGTLNIRQLPSFADRLKFRLSVLLGVWKEGDHRDWDAIRAWARQIRPLVDLSPQI
jgi:menaquinone-dependent protoporphyrinogen IX oxidase